MEKYILAKTLEEALEVLGKYGDRTQVIAGGTDLVNCNEHGGSENGKGG